LKLAVQQPVKERAVTLQGNAQIFRGVFANSSHACNFTKSDRAEIIAALI
jgi:hypothetical protein